MAPAGEGVERESPRSAQASNWEQGRSSSASRLSSSRGSLREIVEEPAESPAAAAAAQEEKLYVAVAKDMKEGKANFLWALQKSSKDEMIVVLHVHRPAQRIPTALGWLPASKLNEKEVAAYRQNEREDVDTSLDGYINLCARARKVERHVIEKDDIGKGIVEAISLHGITKLIMGAAADKHYTRKMKAPRSKTALTVQQQADPSCKIWFVCKGNLICTRDASLGGPETPQLPIANPSPMFIQPELERSRSLAQTQGKTPKLSSDIPVAQDIFTQRSRSANFAALPNEKVPRSSTSGRRANSFVNLWDVASRLPGSLFDEVKTNKVSLPMPKDAEGEIRSFIDLADDDAVHERLKAALNKPEKSRCEANEELYKCQKAEKDLNEAIWKVKAIETMYIKEVKQRKEIEETLEKEKMELFVLKKHRDEIYEELQKAHQRMAELELHISDSDQFLKDIKGKLLEAYNCLDSMQQEHEELRKERDNAIRESEELNRQKEEATISTHGAENFAVFSLSELEKATQNFDMESKIGEGGYGCVYKGFLRHTTVAIKKLNPQGRQGKEEFQREMDVLSKVRHPNLITLIGACPEAWALVYEFLPNGSLEDCLTCKDDTPPLTWQARIRIAAEICSALIFLHSCKPLSVVHGDLKPANILLDANLYTCQPKGTFAYMDPELLSSGEITTKSDVYSFGVIILRLLTRRPAFGVSKVVQDALDKKYLDKILDPSAGNWPYVQAEMLAILGLKCCEMNRRNRPDAKEAWKMLEPFTRSSFVRSPPSFKLALEDGSHVPSYFLCPIFKVMIVHAS
ncbi:hypothetical protein Cni_G27752 [Canna indica]|uniref:RING-type E3 ubiquitin transferase n=1 Tax=Canna indica TaxID=4628 RepID=A0AAQ3L1Z2_9LILI|nr:hypothetical protein Cni_G27752 [Canna indica]